MYSSYEIVLNITHLSIEAFMDAKIKALKKRNVNKNKKLKTQKIKIKSQMQQELISNLTVILELMIFKKILI